VIYHEDFLEVVSVTETHASSSEQFKQILPKTQHVVLAGGDSLDVVVFLRLELLRHRHDGLHSLFVRVYVGLDGLVLLHGRLHRGKVKAEVVLRDQSLVLTQPHLAHAGLAVETCRQLLQFLLPTAKHARIQAI